MPSTKYFKIFKINIMTKTFKLTPNLIEKMCACGLNAANIRNILNLTVDEYDNLFLDEKYTLAVRRGKEIADFNVLEGLLIKATGFEHEDVHFASYKGDIMKEKFKKYYPPDMTAIIFWLKNRCPNSWKEKVEGGGSLDEETLTRLREIAVERMDAKL